MRYSAIGYRVLTPHSDVHVTVSSHKPSTPEALSLTRYSLDTRSLNFFFFFLSTSNSILPVSITICTVFSIHLPTSGSRDHKSEYYLLIYISFDKPPNYMI